MTAPNAELVDHRIWTKVDALGDCWQWTGRLNADGYGTVPVQRVSRLAHRVVYQMLVGPIPVGLELDHLCRNRPCVNPDHLEPVTHAENVRRGVWCISGTRAHQAKTHCPSGHPYAGENLAINIRGARVCRTCARETSRRLYRRRSA